MHMDLVDFKYLMFQITSHHFYLYIFIPESLEDDIASI